MLSFLKPLPKLLQRLFFNPRDIASRDTKLLCNFALGKRLFGAPVFVGDTIAAADYLGFAFVKLLADKAVKLLGVNFQRDLLLNVCVAAKDIRYRQRVALRVGVNRLVYEHLRLTVLLLAKVHFYLVSYYTPTETLCGRDYGDFPDNSTSVSIRIIAAKKPRDSLLCAENIDALSIGERLRVLRLRAGLKIDEAAKAVGIDRGTLMNYELGRVGRMKKVTLEKLFLLYGNFK